MNQGLLERCLHFAKTLWHWPLIHEVSVSLLNKGALFWHCCVLRLDLEEIRKKSRLLQEKGIQIPQRKTPRLIVSFTSFPDRIQEVFAVAYSLLTQSLKPDIVLLWLAEEEFPHKEQDLPEDLLRLCPLGLSICWCENLLSYKKLIPALKQYPEDIIVTADDDIFYPPDWLAPLYTAYLNDPTCIQAHAAFIACNHEGEILPLSARKLLLWFERTTPSAYHHCPIGGPGILYPPHSLHADVVHAEVFLEKCPANDDEWFWAMAIRQRTKIHCLNRSCGPLRFIDPKRQYGLCGRSTLFRFNQSAAGDLQRTSIPALYPDMKEILRASAN
ncbi:MAG: hypothetical protein LBD66_03090 [Holosporales bacterium]|jgi:hypothetical protein|nr:hypothetical protein [Holosporales bacterium]